MQLKEFSLFVPNVESGTVLKALETAIPSSAIEQAIADAEASEERKRALPSHLVVCLIIAMSLWSRVSMRTVLKNLVDGLSEAWIKVGSYWRIPCKSSITEARQRIGSQVITRLFHLIVRPLAIPTQWYEQLLGKNAITWDECQRTLNSRWRKS